MNLQTFNFNSNEIRAIEKDGEPWFIAKEICDILGLENVSRAVSSLHESEKDITIGNTLGGQQRISIVSESGLYGLIFKSRKDEAVKFRIWITSEVLPALRKHGKYEIQTDPLSREESKKARLAFTDTLKKHGCNKQHHFINSTKRIYQIGLGKTTKQIREEKGLLEKSNVRASLAKPELALVMISEIASAYNMEVSQARDYHDCANCIDASAPVIEAAKRAAIDQTRTTKQEFIEIIGNIK